MHFKEDYHFPDSQLQENILRDSEEIHRYARGREGDYARLKTSKMLGVLAAKYSHTPVFINGAPLLMPTPDGFGFGLGEMTGKIAGFTYANLEGEIAQWKPSTEGVVMQVSVPALQEGDAPDAPWRLNALPEEMRNEALEGYIIGVPITESQKILQLGDKEVPLTPQSLITPERTMKEYSYLEYVKKIQALTNNKPTLNDRADVAKIQALDKLIHDMVFECTYLGSVVGINSDYLRSHKPDGNGFKVSTGQVAGVLRKFVHDIYQDYQTKEWLGDMMAVVYDIEVAHLVTTGQMTPQVADQLPTTFYVPLSRPHVLATETGVKN